MRRKVIGVPDFWLVCTVISRPAVQISGTVQIFLIIGGIEWDDSDVAG